MSLFKPKPKTILILVIIIALAAAGYYYFRPEQPATPSGSSGTSTAKPSDTGKAESVYVETKDFKYAKPSGWVKLSQSALDKNAATSGIGLFGKPVFFTVQVNNSAPGSSSELKNSTLNVIKKLPGFVLISSGSTKLDGQAGQKFVYQTSDQSKTRAELTAVIHNKKTFFLLFSVADQNFDDYRADFTAIEKSFQFE